MKSIRIFSASSVVALLLSAGAVRAADESPYKFEFHGFVTGSFFYQDQVFLGGSGQDNLLAAPPAAVAAGNAANPTVKSGSFIGGDVRQSRWIFAMTGPAAFGATPKGYFEGDFYGSNLGEVASTQARLRAAYGELKWGPTQLQVGQYSAQLILAQLSASIAHVANPITFGTGTIGGRAMGLRAIHSMPMGDMKLELAGEILVPKISGEDRPGIKASGPATAASVSNAWASNIPQIGARARIDGKSGDVGYSVYLSGLYETVNLKGFGDVAPNGVTLADGSTKTSVNPWAVEVGGNVSVSLVNVAANFYTGKSTGVWAGAVNQQGDIGAWGFWAQAGVQPNKQVGLYALYGMAAATEDDLRLWGLASGIKSNQLIGGILRFSEGGYTVAAEFFQFKTTRLGGAAFGAPAAPTSDTTGNQLVLSAHYAW